MLPLVETSLVATDWREREAAVLALGAISAGYGDALRVHVPRFAALLLERTRDVQPNVRCNACWAAARYAGLALDSGSAADGEPLARAVVAALLERMQARGPPRCRPICGCAGSV